MNDTQLEVMSGAESETRVESILKAISITLPIAIQLFGLFRRPKAAAATVAVTGKPVAPAASPTTQTGDLAR